MNCIYNSRFTNAFRKNKCPFTLTLNLHLYKSEPLTELFEKHHPGLLQAQLTLEDAGEEADEVQLVEAPELTAMEQLLKLCGQEVQPRQYCFSPACLQAGLGIHISAQYSVQCSLERDCDRVDDMQESYHHLFAEATIAMHSTATKRHVFLCIQCTSREETWTRLKR